MKVVAPREEKIERGGRGEAPRDAEAHSRWPVVELGDVCDVQLGKMLSPKSKTGVRPVPYLRNENVQWDRFDLTDVSWMDFSESEEAKFRLEPGDLLVCEGGEPGRAAIWQGQIERCCYQKALHRIRPRAGRLHPTFLMYRLWLSSRLREFADSQTQTTIAHLPREKLICLRIPLPPLAEQERIAGRLTEQLGAVERARAAAAQRLAAAEALPAALLREVFDGPQASGWETRRIDEVCDLLPSKSIASDGDTEVRAITTACLTERGFRPEGIKTARMRAADVAVSTVRCGELLIARSNTPDLVGRASIYLGEPEGIVASDLTIRLWARGGEGGALPDYLAAYMSFLFQTGYWKERAGGASGSMKKITREQLSAEIVPVPDLPTQRRLAADLGEKLAAAEGVIARCREELAAIDALPASLLRDAFGGGREDEEQEGP